MRTLASLSMAMLFAGALLGQNHSGGRSGPSHGGFHWGGGFRPGGSGLVGSGLVGSGAVGYGAAPVTTYVYPVYVGSGYNYSPDYTASYTDATYVPPPQDVPQSVMTVYPPQPAPAASDQPNPEPVSRDDDSSATQPDHYLIALKDHTIYSVVAYWVSGDTLHYFTSGNVHNQASLSLVDRELTARLNKESGTEVTLPAAK